jgi:tRNA U34 5-carboxymethylaminomethyl modifying enzyme MnmG/GidA
VWIGRITTGTLLVAVVACGKARFEAGAMHVPLAFAARKLLEFSVNVARAN